MEKIYLDYMLEQLKALVGKDSPSGFCFEAARFLQARLGEINVDAKISAKNCVEAFIEGEDSSKTVALLAHVDTLGAMVTSVGSDGSIRFTEVGGPILPTLDGEYCRLYTRSGKVYTGTILSTSPSIHVHKEARTAPRDKEHMYVRLDENEGDIQKLGISAGDYICFEPKFVYTASGYIKSRFLDDKAGVGVILTALKYLMDKNIKPKYNTKIIITSFEEVGHGGAPFYRDIDEAIAVDMGCVGNSLKCTERDVSICAADSSGPYDYELVGRLIELATKNQLDYAVDVYPFYSSDVSVMLRAGGDIKGTVIGMGVHASHGMERTHIKGMENTLKLLLAYLQH